jgi:hypothetical protein
LGADLLKRPAQPLQLHGFAAQGGDFSAGGAEIRFGLNQGFQTGDLDTGFQRDSSCFV